MTTPALVTRQLQRDGFPVRLVRVLDYFQFVYQQDRTYEIHVVQVPNFDDRPFDEWVRIGRQFGWAIQGAANVH